MHILVECNRSHGNGNVAAARTQFASSCDKIRKQEPEEYAYEERDVDNALTQQLTQLDIFLLVRTAEITLHDLFSPMERMI